MAFLDAVDADGVTPVVVSVSFLGGNLARIATYGDSLYVLANPGVLYAFDAENGDLLWTSEVTPGSSIGSGVAVAGHHVVANHYGTIAAYRL